ncbi:cyclase family protein [Robertkochia flava]|uniref:cyclase family protein n=1 Tax=Robertkochia flava TaxID=3447986 RepID=UPI001CD02DB0|nr:cyclase family protein [Robertkochia marina]
MINSFSRRSLLPYQLHTCLLIALVLLTGCTSAVKNEEPHPGYDLSDQRIIDLTHEFSRETVYWVTAREFEMDTVFAGQTENGYYYTANNICTAEHGGTHIDAPVHFSEGKQTVDRIPLENLLGTAIKIDVSEKAMKDPDYQVSIADLNAWEEKHGTPIPDNVIILFYTGHSRHYPDPKTYLGTEERGQDAIALLHFPGIAPEAANWLVHNRKVKAVGLDTPSLDYGQSKDFKTHVILLGENIPGFENLARLDQLPDTPFQVIALPMKIKGGSGGPLRIIALLEN